MPEFAKDDQFVATLIAGAAVMLGKGVDSMMLPTIAMLFFHC